MCTEDEKEKKHGTRTMSSLHLCSTKACITKQKVNPRRFFPYGATFQGFETNAGLKSLLVTIFKNNLELLFRNPLFGRQFSHHQG